MSNTKHIESSNGSNTIQQQVQIYLSNLPKERFTSDLPDFTRFTYQIYLRIYLGFTWGLRFTTQIYLRIYLRFT